MTRIEVPEQDAKPLAESPSSDSAPDTPVQANEPLPHTIEELKGGQAELHQKNSDLYGSIIRNGTVPSTPAENALA